MNVWPAAMDVVRVLGWALLHFIWQAAAIGALYAPLRRCLPRGEARYLLGMLALLALALCPVLTAWRVADTIFTTGGAGIGPVAAVFGTAAAHDAASAATSWQSMLSAALPWLVLAWSLGVAFLSLRVWRHWRALRALVRAAEALPVWQERLRDLAQRFGLRRCAQVLSSARVVTPTLIGWLRPVILLPLAVSSGFPVKQVELILAHELAHLRRFDHLANLFQVVLETLLFYHPVVHWISRDVRNERELCCDALALRVTGGSRREFATALVELEEFREQHAGLTLAASGGVLRERVGRITGVDRNTIVRQPSRFVGALSALLLASLLLSLLWRQAELRRESSGIVLDVQRLTAQLLPASVRMPMQAIANLAPRHLAASPVLAIPIRSSSTSRESGGEPTPSQAPIRLAVAAPVLKIADLRPSRLKLVSLPPAQHMLQPSEVAQVPTPVHIQQPVYPLGALERGIEGKVVLEFSLDADGTVRDPVVVDAQPTGTFDHAATQALLGWKFAPVVQPEANRRYRQIFTFTLHPDSDVAGREIPAKAGCYVVTGSHICRPGRLDEAFRTGALQ